MRRCFVIIIFMISFGIAFAGKLPGFTVSPYFDEQIMDFVYQPGVKVLINAPSQADFDISKPTKLELYALPNGNTTAWTVGKLPAQGDDWHFQIQHIGAQTRFIRKKDRSCNFVTVYLEAEGKSWGAWRKADEGRDLIIKEIVDSLMSVFASYNPSIGLNSHSGGGNFVFGFIDAVDTIPDYVKRISFLDSDYNWNDDRYGEKLCRWLGASSQNSLFVACYDDANALYNGKPFVSRKGGTFYRTDMMRKYVRKNLKGVKWDKVKNDSIVYYTADNRRIQFYSRKNPERKIYHTALVERNGFIQSVFAGTESEGDGYRMMSEHAYDAYRQDSVIRPRIRGFVPRRYDAVTGNQFISRTLNIPVDEREELVYQEITTGNVPDAFRQPVYITDSIADALGVRHEVSICVLPDILAVGDDNDFIRMPMLPRTAQRIADFYGAVLPTTKLSDLIHRHSTVKMEPHPMTPDATMTTVAVFARQDSAVNAVFEGPLGTLVAGHKKDIVITNRIAERPDRVFIYGWHYPDGRPIQPLSGVHGINYVDYSHGVRLISDEVLVDGRLHSIRKLLADSVMYKLFSDEDGPLLSSRYITDPDND